MCLTLGLLTWNRGCRTYTTLGSCRLESFIGRWSRSLLTSSVLLSDTEEVVSVLVLVGLSGWFGITESTSDGGSERRLVFVTRRRVVGRTTVDSRLGLSWLALGDWCGSSRGDRLVVEVSASGWVIRLETRLGCLSIWNKLGNYKDRKDLHCW